MAKGNWRDELDKKMFSILKDQGLETFLEMAVSSLNVKSGGNGQFKAQFVGEICEIVLVGMTQTYLQVEGKEGKVFHSVVLKDLAHPKSDFRTELDFVLLTPSFVLTSECKSYCGEVAIRKECTLVNKFHEVDVYRQSLLHFDKLKLYVAQALKQQGVGRLPVFANAFVFSDAMIADERKPVQKDKLTVLTTASVFDYYDALFKKYSAPVLDYEKLSKVFRASANSKKLHAEHGEFVGY